MSTFLQIQHYIKHNPLKSFLIIIVSLLLGYYLYTNFLKNKHMGIAQEEWSTTGWIIYSLFILLFGFVIPFIIMYFIVKAATRNVLREFNPQNRFV